MILAVRAGLVEVVRELLRRKVDPNVRNGQGVSPLMMAAYEGRTQIASTLVEAGADKRLRNKRRETAAEIALVSGHREVAKLLE